MKGIQRFGVKGKLAPRYIGPFLIIEQCGPVAYRLELPAQSSAVHNIFHVSQLRKCLRVPEKVIDIEKLQLEPDLVYPEQPIKIVDFKTRVTRNQTSNFIRFSGAITPSEKPRGKPKSFLNPNIRSCYKLTKVPTLLYLLQINTSINLGTRFLLGGRIVTLRC